MITSSSSITTSIQKSITKEQYKHTKLIPTNIPTKDSRKWLFKDCCRSNIDQQHDRNNNHSSTATSSKTTAPNNVLVDYCTYHDVAISRVTCV